MLNKRCCEGTVCNLRNILLTDEQTFKKNVEKMKIIEKLEVSTYICDYNIVLYFTGHVQKNDRRCYLRSSVAIFFAHRPFERRTPLASVFSFVLF